MPIIIDKADKLALLGAAYDHEDLLDIITGGLGDDYRAVIDMVNGCDTPVTIDELHEKLIVREHTLNITNPINLSVPVTTIHHKLVPTKVKATLLLVVVIKDPLVAVTDNNVRI